MEKSENILLIKKIMIWVVEYRCKYLTSRMLFTQNKQDDENFHISSWKKKSISYETNCLL